MLNSVASYRSLLFAIVSSFLFSVSVQDILGKLAMGVLSLRGVYSFTDLEEFSFKWSFTFMILSVLLVTLSNLMNVSLKVVTRKFKQKRK